MLVFEHFFSPLPEEIIPLQAAYQRVLSTNIYAPADYPPFARSTMDGFAVRAQDTNHASATNPTSLKVLGEVRNGTSGNQYTLTQGETVQIWTGGVLPKGADAVIKFEDIKRGRANEKTIYVLQAIEPGKNSINRGRDYSSRELIALGNQTIRAQDLAIFAALGITELSVFRRPRMALLATGDELVPPERNPHYGQIRDSNSIALAAMAKESGAVPYHCGICGDHFTSLRAQCIHALQQADILVLSGGTAKGVRDYTLKVFQEMKKTKIISPGSNDDIHRSTIVAQQENKALIGLPGHPASALFLFQLMVRPLIRLYSGLGATSGLRTISARLTHPVSSHHDRDRCIRVNLCIDQTEATTRVTPLFSSPGLLSSLKAADGYIKLTKGHQALPAGSLVQVFLFP